VLAEHALPLDALLRGAASAVAAQLQVARAIAERVGQVAEVLELLRQLLLALDEPGAQIHRALLVAVGDGAINEDGTRRPLDVSEGDEVLYSKYGGTEVTVEDDELLVLRESDVLAKLG